MIDHFARGMSSARTIGARIRVKFAFSVNDSAYRIGVEGRQFGGHELPRQIKEYRFLGRIVFQMTFLQDHRQQMIFPARVSR